MSPNSTYWMNYAISVGQNRPATHASSTGLGAENGLEEPMPDIVALSLTELCRLTAAPLSPADLGFGPCGYRCFGSCQGRLPRPLRGSARLG